MSDREEFITGLRQLADFLTVNPTVPAPDLTVSIQLSADGRSDGERRAVVDRAALAMGVEPVDPYGLGEHWEAALCFGPVKYYVLAVDQRHMEDFREEQRLGREALAAKKAAARQDEADWEAYADCVDADDGYDADGMPMSVGTALLSVLRSGGAS